MARMTSNWLAFWNSSHSIYVSARHRDVHYRLIAEQIAAWVPSAQAHVLDYGSGEALHADLVAEKGAQLVLCEGAPRVRAGLASRFAGNPRIRVTAPDELAALPQHSFDLIVLHSVAQYLTHEETGTLLGLFRRLVKPDGTVMVSDVIPPEVAASTDAIALLRFGAAHGFLLAAIAGLGRTLMSDYWRLRSKFGLTRYDAAEMIARLAAAGFDAQRAPRNLGHNQARMAFVAKPR